MEEIMTAAAVGTPSLDGFPVLQRNDGEIPGEVYLSSTPDNSLWGRLPCEADAPRAAVTPG